MKRNRHDIPHIAFTVITGTGIGLGFAVLAFYLATMRMY